MSFKEELRNLTLWYNSAKLNELKKMLRRVAANGDSMAVVDSDSIDNASIVWLRCEGFEVEEHYDQREQFVRIKW